MNKKRLFTSKMNLEVKKRIIMRLILSECGTVCSRDMDTDESGCPTVGGFLNVDMAKNGKN